MSVPRTFWWDDFELDESSEEIPDKYILTICEGLPEDFNEVAVIVHRTVGGKYPLDGEMAAVKRANATYIVEALNLMAQCDAGRYSVKDNVTGDWL